jgi:hypothetical protein
LTIRPDLRDEARCGLGVVGAVENSGGERVEEEAGSGLLSLRFLVMEFSDDRDFVPRAGRLVVEGCNFEGAAIDLGRFPLFVGRRTSGELEIESSI